MKSSQYSLGARLAFGQGVLVLVVMALFTVIITAIATKRASQEAEQTLIHQADALVDSLASYHEALCGSAEKLGAVFASNFRGEFSVDPAHPVLVGGKETPVLRSGGATLNLNFDAVDHFTELTKAVATVFVRSGDDFIRIATSLKKEDGSRAIGTPLDRNHPAYQGLLSGNPFTGKAVLFGKDFVTRYLPVKDRQGRVIAVLFIGLDFTDWLKTLKEKIKGEKVGKTGYLFVLDAKEGKDQGKLVIHPAKEGANIIESTDASGRKFIKEMIDKKNGVMRYQWCNRELGDTHPREKIAAFRHFKPWNWEIGVGSYLDEFNGIATLIRNTILAATVVAIILLVSLLSVMVRRWVTLPVRRLVEETGRYASGDFTLVTAPVTVAGAAPRDEILLLSQGVGTMAFSLREILGRVMSSAHEIGTAASQVNVAAERIASGTDAVASKTETVATAGVQMSATSEDIARSCQTAADAARQATTSAREGAAVVQKTVTVMNQIAGKVQESARTVESLGEHSNQIGEIIATIEDIADQTNLLALNAAIEAARAGEQGRGFAVVADEVRALAERTTTATHEIGKMIKSIQHQTKEAVSAMEEGVQQVSAGTAEAARSGTAIMAITEQIQAVTAQVDQIATAAEEQSATTGEISLGVHEVTSAMQQTVTGAHESATAAAQLNGNAVELQRLVNQFRLA